MSYTMLWDRKYRHSAVKTNEKAERESSEKERETLLGTQVLLFSISGSPSSQSELTTILTFQKNLLE
jgi:hypothetical protein